MGNQFLEVAVETALEAGGILLSELDRPAKISYKGEVDPVTQAALRSEVGNVRRLRNSFNKRAVNPNIHYYWNFTLRSHGVRRDGSAALDLASVACGRFDGFWEFGLHPWDTAAGVLLVREAGGMVTDFSGQTYRPGDYEMLASNGRIHAALRQIGADIQQRIADGLEGP